MVTTSLKIQSEIKQLAVFAAQAQAVSPCVYG